MIDVSEKSERKKSLFVTLVLFRSVTVINDLHMKCSNIVLYSLLLRVIIFYIYGLTFVGNVKYYSRYADADSNTKLCCIYYLKEY